MVQYVPTAIANGVSLVAATGITVANTPGPTVSPATWLEAGPWAILVISQLYANIHLWRALQGERTKAATIAERTISRLEERDRKFLAELKVLSHNVHVTGTLETDVDSHKE